MTIPSSPAIRQLIPRSDLTPPALLPELPLALLALAKLDSPAVIVTGKKVKAVRTALSVEVVALTVATVARTLNDAVPKFGSVNNCSGATITSVQYAL